jgi:hypothetical protein
MATEDPCAALALACKYARAVVLAKLKKTEAALEIVKQVCFELQASLEEHVDNPLPLIPEQSMAQPEDEIQLPTSKQLTDEIRACRRLTKQIHRFVMR